MSDERIEGTILIDQGLAGSESSEGRYGRVHWDTTTYVRVDWGAEIAYASSDEPGLYWRAGIGTIDRRPEAA